MPAYTKTHRWPVPVPQQGTHHLGPATAAAKHMGTELQPPRRAPNSVTGLRKKREGKGKDLGGLSTGQAVWSRGDFTSFGKQQDTYGRACVPGDSTGEQLLYTVSQIREKSASKGWM